MGPNKDSNGKPFLYEDLFTKIRARYALAEREARPPGNGRVKTDLIRAPNERIPVDAVEFGADCVYDVLRRYRL